MTPTEIQVLVQACRAAGIDANKVQPTNPFEKNGKVADLLQAAVAEIDPAQAAKWRVAAGGSLSVATLAELEAGGDLSAAAKADLYAHDHQFVSDLQKQRTAEQAATEKWLEDQLAASQLRNKIRETGSEAAAKERMKFEAQQDEALRQSREESQRHAREVQGRIDQKRIQNAQMAGRLTNG